MVETLLPIMCRRHSLITFPHWTDIAACARLSIRSTFPISLAGVRHSSDTFLVYTDPIHERLIIETYPAPAVLWNGNVIRRFAPGDAKELIRFLWGLHRGTLSIIEATDGPFSYGATVIQRILAPGGIDVVRREVGFLNDSRSE